MNDSTNTQRPACVKTVKFTEDLHTYDRKVHNYYLLSRPDVSLAAAHCVHFVLVVMAARFAVDTVASAAASSGGATVTFVDTTKTIFYDAAVAFVNAAVASVNAAVAFVNATAFNVFLG